MLTYNDNKWYVQVLEEGGGVTFWSSRIFHKGSGRGKLAPHIHAYSSDPLSAHGLFSLRGFDVWLPGVPSINFMRRLYASIS